MHKDEAKGVGNQVAGSAKEAAGKVTGDERLEGEGIGQKAGGKLQEAVGNVKEAARDALKK